MGWIAHLTADSSEGWDSEFSDGGTWDCEILNDTSGTARKMWETAASRKKMPNGVHESREGRSTASTSSAGSETTPDENADGLFDTEYNLDENIFRYFGNAWKEDAQNGTGCSKSGTAECHLNENMQFSDAWKGVQNSSGDAKDGHGSSSVPNANEHSNGKETDCRGSSEEKEFVQNSNGAEKDGHGSSSMPNANEHSNGKETDCRGSSNLDPGMACNDKTAHSHDDVVPEKAPDGIQSPHLDKTFVSANRVFPSSSSAVRKDGSPPMFVSTPEKVDEKISGGVCPQKDQSPPDAYNIINKDTYAAQDDGSASGQQKAVPPFTSTCDCSRQFRENCSQVLANSCACAAASIKNTSVNVTSGSCSLHRKDLVDLGRFTLVQDTSDFQDGLIGECERHKESVEFKRAAEEDWASRQRQLQIQADEAKKLRKRKKAEALRLLDMEKRQKQRLQEVHESQRKNEEEIQLKEQYRGTVRKELEDTERRYRDMASILRALGIPVQGGEVKAAFKQALLKFHPDRVSRNDVYQQVKAEETFKFISRLKEKLPRFV